MYHDKMMGALEAVLFAAGEPIGVAELARCLQLDKPQVWELLSSLEHSYEDDTRGLMLRQVGGGYQLVTKPVHYGLVSNLSRKKEVKLTNAAMETLAIIAFKQPITRAEMEAIRGVKVDGVVNTLLDLGLIAEAGRKKALGKPYFVCYHRAFFDSIWLGQARGPASLRGCARGRRAGCTAGAGL